LSADYRYRPFRMIKGTAVANNWGSQRILSILYLYWSDVFVHYILSSDLFSPQCFSSNPLPVKGLLQRVPECLSSRMIWVPPPPHALPRKRVWLPPPHMDSKGGATLACRGGGGGTQFRRLDRQTLWYWLELLLQSLAKYFISHYEYDDKIIIFFKTLCKV
jgi:hypothetical protein